MSQPTATLDSLLARVEATRGALSDMRDWCEEMGYPAAQHASPAAVVKRVEQRFRGGVDAFLIGY